MKSKLFCPDCKSELSQHDQVVICGGCSKEYKTDNGIVIFDKNISENTEKYWNEVVMDQTEEPYLLEFLPEKTFDDVLDLGCGEGRATVAVSRIAKNVYGIDSSIHLLKKFLTRSLDNATLIQGDAKKLPFPDNFFDLTVSFSVVEHIPFQDIHGVFAEVYRTLKPGGIFLVRNDAWFYRVLELLRIRPGMIGNTPDSTHVNMMTGSTFKKALMQAGFSIDHESHFPFYRYQKKYGISLPWWIQRLFATHSNFVCKK
jgi:ubiquinone/menaquinone biosynthesis C-methylase UbiE